MKILHVASLSCVCIWLVGCGTSTTSTSSDDVAIGDSSGDATDSDTLADSDTATGDVPLSDTLSYKYPTCAAVTDCVRSACTGTDANCTAPCFKDAAPAAMPAVTDLLACVQSKCADGQCKTNPDSSCMTDCISLRCMPQIFTCIEDGKTGSKGCADVKTCFDTCNAGKTNVTTCLQTCYEGISAAGKAKAKPFADCVAAAPAGGDPTAGCMKETFGCFLDGKTGAKGCYESMGCLGACDKASDGFTCTLDCFGQMTKAGQDAFLDVSPCLGKDVTMTTACEDKLVVCLAPTGTQTCDEALGCVMGCGENNNDPTCTFTCLHNTTSAADKLLLSKLGCDPKDSGCIAGLLQCIDPQGTAACPAIIDCSMKCSPSQGQSPEPKCLFACIKQGSTTSAASAYAALNCMGKYDQACLGALTTCFSPSGTQGCYDTTTCVQTCYQTGGANLSSCVNGCYGAASIKGFEDFITWNGCHQACDATCKGDQTCVNTCTGQQCPTVKSTCAPPT